MPIDPRIVLATQTAAVPSPIDSMAKITQLRSMQEQQQALGDERRARADLLRTQQEERQNKIADAASLDEAFSAAGDRQAILAKVPGHLRGQVEKQFAEIDEADNKRKEAKSKLDDAEGDYFGALAYSVKAHGYDPQAATIALADAKAKGHDITPIISMLQQNPDSLPQVVDGLIARSKTYSQRAETERAAKAREAETAAEHERIATDKATDNARLDAQAKETKRHNEIEENLAARRLALSGGTGQDADSVAFWVRQVQNDPSQWSMLSNNKPLQQAVQAGLGKAGVDLTKITAQSRAMSETAKELLPRIDVVKQEAQELEALGLMGPLAGKWRDLVAGKIGAESLVGGGENGRKVGKFLTDVGLLETGAARAHGGARGGGSPMMLKHMESIMGAGGKDLSIFLGNLDATKEWMQGYASMTEPKGETKTTESSGPKPTHRFNPQTGKVEEIQ